jgi:S-adenosylmethionine decarboxylase
VSELPYGPHLAGDLSGCSAEKLSGLAVERLLLDVIEFAGMTPMGPPHRDAYTGPHPSWVGDSVTVHIQTSHVTGHAFERLGYLFVDLFSCAPFDAALVATFIEERLEAQHARWHCLRRGTSFPRELLDPAQLALVAGGRP